MSRNHKQNDWIEHIVESTDIDNCIACKVEILSLNTETNSKGESKQI